MARKTAPFLLFVYSKRLLNAGSIFVFKVGIFISHLKRIRFEKISLILSGKPHRA